VRLALSLFPSPPYWWLIHLFLYFAFWSFWLKVLICFKNHLKLTLSSTTFTATMNRGHFYCTRNHHNRDGSHGSTSDPSSSNYDGHSFGNYWSHCSYNPCCKICKTEDHTTDWCQNRYDRVEPLAHIAETFSSSTSDWYLDTGDSAHMTPDSTALTIFEQYIGKDKIIVGNGAYLPITHTGTSQPFPNLKLLDVLLVPHLTKILLFISKLTKDFTLLVTCTYSSFVI